MGTVTRGMSRAAACASNKPCRTACMATRAADALTVVSKATVSTSCRVLSVCNAQALSLPLLHAIQALGRVMRQTLEVRSRSIWICRGGATARLNYDRNRAESPRQRSQPVEPTNTWLKRDNQDREEDSCKAQPGSSKSR